MKNKLFSAVAQILALLCAASALSAPAGADAPESDVAVTIYSAPSKASHPPAYQARMQQVAQAAQPVFGPRSFSAREGFGVVKEIRTIVLPEGISRYRFRDVAARLDPTTVKFRCLTNPRDTVVLEQNFEYDLVNKDRLMEKYIGRRVVFEPPAGLKARPIEGTLLSTDGGPILSVGEEVYINPPGDIVLPRLPEGLITRPTLEWLIRASAAGPRRVEVAYQTEGLSWEAAYTALLGGDEKALDLSAWVTIPNRSGATYRNARLKLVAGEVHRVEPPRSQVRHALLAATAEVALARPQGFEEKQFFEYHLYTLGRRTTIADNSTKQIELFRPVEGVPVEKIYLYCGFPQRVYYGGSPNRDRSFGTRCNKAVNIYLKFKNEKKAGLGVPLPAGRVRLFMQDPADGDKELIGEDWIDHTPKDEDLLLRLGTAFDLVGERKQTDFKVDRLRRRMSESFEIALRNHKETPVRVIVKEVLYRWMNWKIERADLPFEKKDARTIHFAVEVPAGGERRFAYTVLYTW